MDRRKAKLMFGAGATPKIFASDALKLHRKIVKQSFKIKKSRLRRAHSSLTVKVGLANFKVSTPTQVTSVY